MNGQLDLPRNGAIIPAQAIGSDPFPTAGTTLTDLGCGIVFANPDMPNPQGEDPSHSA